MPRDRLPCAEGSTSLRRAEVASLWKSPNKGIEPLPLPACQGAQPPMAFALVCISGSHLRHVHVILFFAWCGDSWHVAGETLRSVIAQSDGDDQCQACRTTLTLDGCYNPYYNGH
jgi:hypothetical protein